jgi:hypothetical protein
MSDGKKVDKKVVYYVVGGAILGAIAGYIVNRVGMKNIMEAMKAKNIIPENIADTISDFADRSMEEFEDED